MVSLRPAYSAAFLESRLAEIRAMTPVRLITPEWAWGDSTGKGVRVAVMDSGVDATHPAVGSVQGYVRITENKDGTLAYDTEPHDDTFGHGTACAGVIREMAPDCELYSIKVLGTAQAGTARVVAAGMRWAIENEVRVCNMSLGVRKPEFAGVLHELADAAYFKNVIMVTAAPNDRDRPSFPSLYSSVLSVASHGIPDPYTFFYNPSPPVEFGAWGIDVRLAWREHQYRTATGNSFAAPRMAGLVAKILGKHPNMTLFQIKTVLRELSTNVDSDEVSPAPHMLGDRRTTAVDGAGPVEAKAIPT